MGDNSATANSSAKYTEMNGGSNIVTNKQQSDLLLTELEVKKPLNGELCNNHVDFPMSEGLDTNHYNMRVGDSLIKMR